MISEQGSGGRVSEAFELLEAGREHEAKALLDQAIRDARTKSGPNSTDTAAAWHDRARLSLALNDFDGAVTCLRSAVEVDRRTDQGREDSLLYTLDLGRTLLRIGNLHDADIYIRESVAGRAEIHGEAHPEFGAGLDALAELARAQGDLTRADSLIQQAIGLLWPSRDPRAAAAFGLSASILVELGKPARFGTLDLPDDWVEDVAGETCRVLERGEPRHAVAVLSQLIRWIETRGSTFTSALLHLHADRAEAARRAGDHATRIESLKLADELAESSGNLELSLQAAQGLALALHEVGQLEEAEETYRDAADRADAAGLRSARSSVLRNYGLFLSETERDLEAEAVLREAIADSEGAGDEEQLGRALTALGIFLQHDHRLAEARPLLRRAIEKLGSDQADGLLARSHLQAIDRGTPCGCGVQADLFATLLRQLIEPQVPQGLIAGLRLDKDAGVDVDLTRPPTEEEAKHLDVIIQESMRTLQRMIDERNFG
jgi:tetratricopeptide (TPR) repeat protein